MAGGRPPKYKTVEDLASKADAYFGHCLEIKELPEKAGLCLALGISRDTYSEYRKKPEFADAIKGFDSLIESAWVKRLAGNSPTGAIFYLKNAFSEHYRDRQETDVTSGGEAIKITWQAPM